MDMKQLVTFRTLTQTLNYQKAADQLQYAPSTLFKHIQLLEQTLGVTLFCKQGRQIQLTLEGQIFQEHANSILDSYYHALDSLSSRKKLEGSLTIGGCEINLAHGLLDLLTEFSQKNSKIRISMMMTPNADVPMMVKKGMIDVGFMYSIAEAVYQDLKCICLYEEPVYLFVSDNHPLLQRTNLHYEDLEGMDFVYSHDTCCFVTELFRRLKCREVKLGERAYIGSIKLVTEHVSNDGTLTLAPASAVEQYANAYHLKRLALAEEPIWARQTLLYQNYEALNQLARELVRTSLDYAARKLDDDADLASRPFHTTENIG